MSATYELFHRLADRACGNVRTRIMDSGAGAKFSFRNVHFDSHKARLADVGGTGEVPAIFDGEQLHVGEEACLAFVEKVAKG